MSVLKKKLHLLYKTHSVCLSVCVCACLCVPLSSYRNPVLARSGPNSVPSMFGPRGRATSYWRCLSTITERAACVSSFALLCYVLSFQSLPFNISVPKRPIFTQTGTRVHNLKVFMYLECQRQSTLTSRVVGA